MGMKKIILLTYLTPLVSIGFSQSISILIYHETNGFRHRDAITECIGMLESYGTQNNWIVEDSQTASVFTEQNLTNYDVVVWANTSGNELLDNTQQAAFEKFIRAGGGFVGIHAATDTYRNRSWPWYNDLVGAIVQTNPNHTRNNTAGAMDVLVEHPIVEHLDEVWTKDEEWYYWELNGGYIFDQNINLLRVRSTGDNSYDAARPITWYKEYDGGKSFYTALGHNGSDYVVGSDFGELIKNAIIWTASEEDDDEEPLLSALKKALVPYPNPTSKWINLPRSEDILKAEIIDSSGKRLMVQNKIKGAFNVNRLKSGFYVLRLTYANEQVTHRIRIK